MYQKIQILLLSVFEKSNVADDDSGTPFFDEENPSPLVEQSLEFCKNFQAAWTQTTQFVSTLVDLDLLIERRADVQSPSGEKFFVKWL